MPYCFLRLLSFCLEEELEDFEFALGPHLEVKIIVIVIIVVIGQLWVPTHIFYWLKKNFNLICIRYIF